MTRGEMRACARLVLGETKEDFYKDTEINDQITWATIKVAAETLANLTFSDSTTTAGVQRYPLPSDIMALKDIQIIDGSVVDGVAQPGSRTWALKILSYDKFQSMNQTVYRGQPTYYRVEFGAVSLVNTTPGDFWISPIPDKVYTRRVVYYQKPTKMDLDTDICELAEITHEAVYLRAAMIMSRKSKDRNLITELAAMYNDGLETAKRALTMQDSTGPKHVRNVYRC